MSATLKHPDQDIKNAFLVEEKLTVMYFCSHHSFYIHIAPPFHEISHRALAQQQQGLGILCAHCSESVDTTEDHGHVVLYRVKNDSTIHYFATEFQRQGFLRESTRKHTHFWLPVDRHSTHLQIDQEWHTHQQTADCHNGNCQDFFHLRTWLCSGDCSCTRSHLVE